MGCVKDLKPIFMKLDLLEFSDINLLCIHVFISQIDLQLWQDLFVYSDFQTYREKKYLQWTSIKAFSFLPLNSCEELSVWNPLWIEFLPLITDYFPAPNTASFQTKKTCVQFSFNN